MSGNFELPDFLNTIFFIVLPYIALFSFFLISILRYTSNAFTFSSLSSQFLENKFHFWAQVPFHFGIIFLFFGHLIGLLFPSQVLIWNTEPLRLYILEVSAFIGGILTLVGLINIVIRRLTDAKARIVTSISDWIVFSILIVQVFSGLFTATFHSWGSSWFATSASPYLWSIFTLTPDISFISAMPFMVKLHIIGAYIIVLLFPFTRLVHVLVVPNPYLWRRPQVVRWNWNFKIRNDVTSSISDRAK